MAADAPRLDVDDAARAELDRFLRGAHGVERFIQADGGLNPLLEARVVADVVIVEGLLDHHQVEAVQSGEVIRVRQSVGGVGIDHQSNRPEAGTDYLDGREVPPPLDLDLDPSVSCGELGIDTFSELSQRVLDTDRNSGCYP